VTGAAQGLGYAAAARLAADGAGVALLDRDEERLGAAADALRAEGLTVLPHTVDLTDEEGVRAAVAAILSA
jgi:NAD(P)-dependent dehydrogenase (short-subunit alcohol dehydrogenase family)